MQTVDEYVESLPKGSKAFRVDGAQSFWNMLRVYIRASWYCYRHPDPGARSVVVVEDFIDSADARRIARTIYKLTGIFQGFGVELWVDNTNPDGRRQKLIQLGFGVQDTSWGK